MRLHRPECKYNPPGTTKAPEGGEEGIFACLAGESRGVKNNLCGKINYLIIVPKNKTSQNVPIPDSMAVRILFPIEIFTP